MKKIISLITIFTAIILSSQDTVLLKDGIVTLSCRGISFIGSGITIDDAKMFAVNDAKRTALEQVGTYLESHMEMKDYMVTRDDITTYTAGILKVEILSTENRIIEGTFAVEVTINAEIDTEFLKQRLSQIQDDSELRKMLEEQKRLNDRLTKEIESLRDQKPGYEEKSRSLARSLEAADWFDLGFEAQEREDYEKALENYTKALRLDPNIAQIYNNRGLIYYHMRDFPMAEGNFDRAIELDPKLCMAYNNKAIIYYERRLYDQAISYFNKVIELDPSLEQAYYNRAFSYHRIGKTQKCIDDLKTYLKMAGNRHGDEQRIINFIAELEKTAVEEKAPPEPETVTVPNLYNMSPSAAKKRIEDSGLVLGIIKPVTDIHKGFDRVIGQSLRSGTQAKKGAVIDITVNEEARLGW